MNPAVAALLGSIATAVAIFGGGLAVEAYRHHRSRVGMALALAGAIEAMLGLVEARGLAAKLQHMRAELVAGRPASGGPLIEDNRPFQVITEAYADRIGDLGGDLPFRVARFVTYTAGLRHDIGRLTDAREPVDTRLALFREMGPFWDGMEVLGRALVDDLRAAAFTPALADLRQRTGALARQLRHGVAAADAARD